MLFDGKIKRNLTIVIMGVLAYSLFFRYFLITKYPSSAVIYNSRTDRGVSGPNFATGRWIMENAQRGELFDRIVWNFIYYSAFPFILIEKTYDTKIYSAGSKEYELIHRRIEKLQIDQAYDSIYFSDVTGGYGAVYTAGTMIRKWENTDRL